MLLTLLKFLKNTLLIVPFWGMSGFLLSQDLNIKTEQLKNKKVKIAYDTKIGSIRGEIEKLRVDTNNFEVLIRAFKIEKELDIWLRNHKDEKFALYKSFPICETSGRPGPKRREGDLQVPEGIYEIKSFNENSKYHLSMLISYPNKSDKIKGKKPLGGAIMIHGKCKTIGCMPMTDEIMESIYIICLESYSFGHPIRVESYPCRMDSTKVNTMMKKYGGKHKRLWTQLNKSYSYFEEKKIPVNFKIDNRGNYIFNP
jgi:murein L,D-transpeptidase YafK